MAAETFLTGFSYITIVHVEGKIPGSNSFTFIFPAADQSIGGVRNRLAEAGGSNVQITVPSTIEEVIVVVRKCRLVWIHEVQSDMRGGKVSSLKLSSQTFFFPVEF